MIFLRVITRAHPEPPPPLIAPLPSPPPPAPARSACPSRDTSSSLSSDARAPDHACLRVGRACQDRDGSGPGVVASRGPRRAPEPGGTVIKRFGRPEDYAAQ